MSSGDPPKQQVIDPWDAAQAQAYWNRVGQSGPGGSTRYSRNANGQPELQTLISDNLLPLMSSRMGLALTRSRNLQASPQQNSIFNALQQRIAARQGANIDGMAPAQLGYAPERAQFDWQNPAALAPDAVAMPPPKNNRRG